MFGCAVTKVYVGICAVRRTSGSSISPHRLKRQLYRMEATVWPVCMSHIRVRSLSHARRKRSSGAKEVLWTLSKRPNNCRRASFRTSATNEAPGGRARVGQRRVVVVGLNDVCAFSPGRRAGAVRSPTRSLQLRCPAKKGSALLSVSRLTGSISLPRLYFPTSRASDARQPMLVRVQLPHTLL